MDIAAIKQRASELAPEITEMRHYLHSNPELSWQEVNTSKFIESKLKEYGLSNIKRGFGGTECGVTAEIIGDANGPCIALRADIDALPVTEEGFCDYRSTNGAMHACGHDGHISTMLGVTKLLAAMKDKIPGKIRFIFQPAEEHGKRSGALEMIKDGVLEGVQAIGGMHLWSTVPLGRVLWMDGPAMAAVDDWSVTFTGKGGHGAMPHQAIDPTIPAGSMIGALQSIVSREMNPSDTVVISIGVLQAADGAFNIIPETVRLVGNTRSFTDEIHDSLPERITRMADGIAAAHRCTAKTEINVLYPSVINHSGTASVLRESAVSVVGEDNVEQSLPYMVSEDFSYYQRKVPGMFFFLGAGTEETKTNYPHHSPNFNIDDRALPIGVSVMSVFALNLLEGLKNGTFKA